MTARLSLASLINDAKDCGRCPLYRLATPTVFGEGPSRAPVMLVGEQPGDKEDLQGRPFVGPAGKILDRALDLRPDLPGLVTIHPSFLLRIPDPDAKALEYRRFVQDLRLIAKQVPAAKRAA